jgi:carbamoyltransferase
VRPEWREKVAAIVHVDGTARVQTVRRDQNPKFHALISAFDKLTGVPVVLNTSFNDRGEPIVETPMNAVDTFLSTGIDVLVLHDLIIHKSMAYRLFFPVHKLVKRVERNMSTDAWMAWYERNVLSK